MELDSLWYLSYKKTPQKSRNPQLFLWGFAESGDRRAPNGAVTPGIKNWREKEAWKTFFSFHVIALYSSLHVTTQVVSTNPPSAEESDHIQVQENLFGDLHASHTKKWQDLDCA